MTDVTYVAATGGALPSEPSIKLNAMEAQWVLFLLVQHLLLFEGDDLPPFDAILKSLRSSVATTLATHVPLAGKPHYLVDTCDVAICCSTGCDDDNGVRFVAVKCNADVRRLMGDEDHDVLTFMRLVSELETRLLPVAPLLAVYATRLAGGGVALVVSVHHAVTGGPSL